MWSCTLLTVTANTTQQLKRRLQHMLCSCHVNVCAWSAAAAVGSIICNSHSVRQLPHAGGRSSSLPSHVAELLVGSEAFSCVLGGTYLPVQPPHSSLPCLAARCICLPSRHRRLCRIALWQHTCHSLAVKKGHEPTSSLAWSTVHL